MEGKLRFPIPSRGGDKGVGLLLALLQEKYIVRGLFFFAGYFIGLFPLFMYLLQKNLFFDFLNSFKQLSELTSIAKTPFIPSLKSRENIFTLGILVTTITYLSYKYFFTKIKFSFALSLQLVLTIGLIILEQKSIIRSIDTQITFFAFFIYIVFLYQWKKYIKPFMIIIFMIPPFFIGFRHVSFLRTTQSLNLPACMRQNLSPLLNKNTTYDKIKRKLKSQPDFNEKVFSFPGDPIFYVLFNQTPPYYFQTYDGSSSFGQKKRIDYIKQNNIQYVLINTNTKAIQDGVPDYIRASDELHYILTHFEIIDQINSFLILKKTNTSVDFFNNSFLKKNKSFSDYLLHINIGSIPKSEGYYKTKSLSNKRVFHSFTELNTFLAKNSISSKNTFLTIIPHEQTAETISLHIASEHYQATVTFDRCKQKAPCIIHLSRIPLFYKESIIKKISSVESIQATIEIFHSQNSHFW